MFLFYFYNMFHIHQLYCGCGHAFLPRPDLDCRGPWAISLRGPQSKYERAEGGGGGVPLAINTFRDSDVLMPHFTRALRFSAAPLFA